MFLSLVFLAELVAGISGFVFRHEVSNPIHCLTNYKSNTTAVQSAPMLLTCVIMCVCLHAADKRNLSQDIHRRRPELQRRGWGEPRRW